MMTTDQLLFKAAKSWLREHPTDAEILRVSYSTFANAFLAAAERACWSALNDVAGVSPDSAARIVREVEQEPHRLPVGPLVDLRTGRSYELVSDEQ